MYQMVFIINPIYLFESVFSENQENLWLKHPESLMVGSSANRGVVYLHTEWGNPSMQTELHGRFEGLIPPIGLLEGVGPLRFHRKEGSHGTKCYGDIDYEIKASRIPERLFWWGFIRLKGCIGLPRCNLTFLNLVL
jgi:hypothetical protein